MHECCLHHVEVLLSYWYYVSNTHQILRHYLMFVQLYDAKQRHSFSFASKSQFSLSVSSASAAMLNAMTSKSEKRGTGPGQRTLPASVTKSSEKGLHISRNLTNFVYKLHITRLYNLNVRYSKLLKICDICNFFLYILFNI